MSMPQHSCRGRLKSLSPCGLELRSSSLAVDIFYHPQSHPAGHKRFLVHSQPNGRRIFIFTYMMYIFASSHLHDCSFSCLITHWIYLVLALINMAMKPSTEGNMVNPPKARPLKKCAGLFFFFKKDTYPLVFYLLCVLGNFLWTALMRVFWGKRK